MSETEAQKAIEAFFIEFNNRDSKALAQTLHYPHVRVNGKGKVIILKDAEESINRSSNSFEYLDGNEGWGHSSLDQVEVVDQLIQVC